MERMETLNQAILYKEKRKWWVAIIFMFSFYELNKQLDFYYKWINVRLRQVETELVSFFKIIFIR